jgi:hypothetical protein
MERLELTFRVFVSSTFSDLKAEREALQMDVFPRLREYCQKHGCRFQAIDLPWGVPANDLDNETATSWEYVPQWIDDVELLFRNLKTRRRRNRHEPAST